MSASPADTAATLPADETLATAVLDDCHVALLVTPCVVPFDNVAAALNCCALPPIDGVLPETETALTVGVVVAGDGDGEDPLPEHALINAAHKTAARMAPRVSRMIRPRKQSRIRGTVVRILRERL